MKLAPNILAVLSDDLAIDPAAYTIRLTRRFDDAMDLYQGVARALTDLGGVYRSRGRRDGVFVYPCDPSELIGGVLDTSELNPLAFFATQPTIAAQIVAGDDRVTWNEDPTMVALEPSAGQGVFVQAVLDGGWRGQIVAIECDPTNLRVLHQRFGANPRVTIIDGRFEDYDGTHGPFYVIMMNPPFSYGGRKTVYMDHVRRARSLLHHGGQLHAIVPLNWRVRTDTASAAFADLITRCGAWEPLPAGSFQGAGTSVDTCVITLGPDDPRQTPAAPDGYVSWDMHMLDIYLHQDYDFYNERTALWRKLWHGDLRLDLFDAPLPATRAAVLNLYTNGIARYRIVHDWFVVLTPSEQDWLIRWALDEYAEAQRADDWPACLEHTYGPVMLERTPKRDPASDAKRAIPRLWHAAADVEAALHTTLSAIGIDTAVVVDDLDTVTAHLPFSDVPLVVMLPNHAQGRLHWQITGPSLAKNVWREDDLCPAIAALLAPLRVAPMIAALRDAARERLVG